MVVSVVMSGVVSVVVSVSELCVPHRHEFENEKEKYRHQADALNPGVFGDWSRETRMCQSVMCRGKQLAISSARWQSHVLAYSTWAGTYMNKSCSYNYTRAEILGDKEEPFRGSDAWISCRVDWEYGAQCRACLRGTIRTVEIAGSRGDEANQNDKD